jgi:PPOX class probable FMN-dependent enzyme
METTMTSQFEEIVRTREALRRIVKEPSSKVSHKAIRHIDGICHRFIAASPFVVVASRGVDGRLDVSPRGDPPGFVEVLDEKTLAIPDRLGNNRVDTFENLLADSAVGLMFMIPGNGDTLRVSGRGAIVRDSALRQRLSHNGKAPNLALVVSVEEAFMHCPKAIVRSALWSPESWPDRTGVPSLAEAMVAHGRLDTSVREMEAIIENDRATRLY